MFTFLDSNSPSFQFESSMNFFQFPSIPNLNSTNSLKYNSSFLSTESSMKSMNNSFDGKLHILERDIECQVKKTESADYRMKYKTEICKYWREKGFCQFADNCAFAHGYHEIREKVHVPTNYKTKKCKKFHENGYCPYGARCQFLHLSNQLNYEKEKNYAGIKLNGYENVLNKAQELWNKEENSFNLTHQNKKRLSIFQEISENIQSSQSDVTNVDSFLESWSNFSFKN